MDEFFDCLSDKVADMSMANLEREFQQQQLEQEEEEETSMKLEPKKEIINNNELPSCSNDHKPLSFLQALKRNLDKNNNLVPTMCPAPIVSDILCGNSSSCSSRGPPPGFEVPNLQTCNPTLLPLHAPIPIYKEIDVQKQYAKDIGSLSYLWNDVHENEEEDEEVEEQVYQLPPGTIYHSNPFSMGLCNWRGVPLIVKLTNISWDISRPDVLQFVEGLQIVGIHIPIDRSTGKSKNLVFLEIFGTADLSIAVDDAHLETMPIPASLHLRSGSKIKGRSVTISRSSWKEMIECHFPNACPTTGFYLTRDEINSILNICRNYKIHFSRKCAERPFEHVISILQLVPYHRLSLVGRDHMFEFAKLTIESLKIHLLKKACQIQDNLMDRLLQTCLQSPMFTERQKSVLRKARSTLNPANMPSKPNSMWKYYQSAKREKPDNQYQKHHAIVHSHQSSLSTSPNPIATSSTVSVATSPQDLY